MTLLTVVIMMAVFLKALDLIYLFQIKEYRFDRFFSHLKEEGTIWVLYWRGIRMPAITLRNVLLTLTALIFLIMIYFYFSSTWLVLFSAILLPVFSLMIIYPGLLLTSLMAYVSRSLTINRAKKRLSKSKVATIAITGSYGKTTTKEFLFQILSRKYKVAKSTENMNTPVGVAISVLKNLKPDTDYFIAEIGAYKKGEIREVCDFIHPTYGILTAIGNQHLDLFGSRENLISAKKELLQSLPKNGQAYMSIDFEERGEMKKNLACPIITFSLTNRQADIWPEKIKATVKDTSTKIHRGKKIYNISTSLVGQHFISNLLPCFALAQDLKVSTSDIIDTIRQLQPVAKRSAIIKGINQATVIDDSYNSGLHSFLAAIGIAKIYKLKHKYILSRGIIELGEEKKKSYKKILDELVKTNIVLATIDPLFKKLDNKNKVLFFSDEKLLLQYIINHSNGNSLIIIEGKFMPTTIDKLLTTSK